MAADRSSHENRDTLEVDMSTIPGQASWHDAGLEEPPLAQPVELPDEPEDYVPPEPRPDLAGSAEEADVAEQVIEVAEDESDEYR
jgi:hypothetical protein